MTVEGTEVKRGAFLVSAWGDVGGSVDGGECINDG